MGRTAEEYRKMSGVKARDALTYETDLEVLRALLCDSRVIVAHKARIRLGKLGAEVPTTPAAPEPPTGQESLPLAPPTQGVDLTEALSNGGSVTLAGPAGGGGSGRVDEQATPTEPEKSESSEAPKSSKKSKSSKAKELSNVQTPEELASHMGSEGSGALATTEPAPALVEPEASPVELDALTPPEGEMWVCRKCGHKGPQDDFGVRHVDGHTYSQPYCRPCRRVTAMASYYKTRDRNRAEAKALGITVAELKRRKKTAKSVPVLTPKGVEPTSVGT